MSKNLVEILDGYKVGELKELAKTSGLKGYSKLKKAELVDAVSKQLEQVEVASLDVPDEIKNIFVKEETKEKAVQKKTTHTKTPIIGVAPHVMNVAKDGQAPYVPVANPIQHDKKIYPNDPCPCGSGKKYKKCCGKRA